MSATRPHALPAAISARCAGGRPAVLRSYEELAGVRETWLARQGDSIATDPDYFAAAARSDPLVERPHVVLAEDGRGLAVARVERAELPCRIGYATVLRPELRLLSVVSGGLLAPDKRTARLLVDSLWRSVESGEADALAFRNVPLDSSLVRLAEARAPRWCRQHLAPRHVHWELPLPSSLDELLATRSRSTRQGLTRYAKRLERELGERASLRSFREASELPELARDVRAVAERTYQHGLGLSFGDGPADLELAGFCLERGWFRAYVLYLDGRPVAFWHGDLYRGRFRTGRPGFDPALAEHRPGTYVLLRMVDDLCRERVRVLDHGTGDAEYKRRLGERSWVERNVLLYAPRARPVAVNAARTALLGVGSAGGRAARSLHVSGRIRRAWRARLSGR